MTDVTDFWCELTDLSEKYPPNARLHVKHDGFSGSVRGYYVTLEGKPGLVLQLDNTKVIHVYSSKWFEAVKPAGSALPQDGQKQPLPLDAPKACHTTKPKPGAMIVYCNEWPLCCCGGRIATDEERFGEATRP